MPHRVSQRSRAPIVVLVQDVAMEENTSDADNNDGVGAEDQGEIGCCCYVLMELAVYLILIFVIVPLLLLCCLLGCCLGVEIVRVEAPEPMIGNTHFDSPEEMRAYIESKLITRKVVAADGKRKTRFSEVMGDMSSRDAALSSLVAAIRLPEERSIKFSEPTRSGSAGFPSLVPALEGGSSEEDEEEPVRNEATTPENDMEEGRNPSLDSEGLRERRKCNTLVRSISSSIRSMSQSGGSDQPSTCNICLLDYEVGDEVCWSPNSDCVHAYHKECIVPWLMTNPSCPECRRNYLQDSKGSDKDDEEEEDQDPDNAAEHTAANISEITTDNV